MTNRRNKLLKKLIGTAIGEDEKKLYQLTIERVCADMCDFYTKFYSNEGPGAMVYVPTHEDENKSMFYLTVNNLITAVDDLTKNDLEGAADVMKKAITRAVLDYIESQHQVEPTLMERGLDKKLAKRTYWQDKQATR